MAFPLGSLFHSASSPELLLAPQDIVDETCDSSISSGRAARLSPLQERIAPPAKTQGVDLLQTLKVRLAETPGHDLPPHPHLRAGVLVPVFEAGGVPHLLLTKRTETVEHHKGQISFPGGRQEDLDPDLLTTALREAFEEIGLEPSSVDVWGRLDEIETVVSGFAITPYVGLVPPPVGLRPNPYEIDEIITVPLPVFLDPTNLRVEQHIRDGRPRDLLFYSYPPHVIWGATARIISGLVGLLTTEPARGSGR